MIGEIPWLFPDPQASLAEWRSRLLFLLQELEREARVTRAELAESQLSEKTRQRLELWAGAHEDHARRLKQFLEPLGIGGGASYETHLALRTRLPSDQGLTNYYVNVHRDWAWGDAENRASLALIRSALPDGYVFGRTLVLGAGAGRLTFDLHMQCDPAMTVATDFNPLLLFVSRDVVRGGRVELYEFPIAPRRIEDQAVLRTLAAPEPVRSGFFLVGADALHAPFAPGAFDTVVTPWFIDIIPEELGSFAARLNALLAPGGSWINFGSVSFSQAKRAARLTLEETLDVAEQAGFARPQAREETIPYMQSPASRHARMETVVAWCARKERSVPEPAPYSALPEWLLFTDRPVPRLEDFQVQAVSTRIYAFLMALIDGQRSVQDMARMLVEQRLMMPQDAEPAVRRFLTRMYEDSQRRTSY
ncbi:MAG TPA: hypothetical protein VIL32_15685 [Steroidobacteraceae bacterium]